MRLQVAVDHVAAVGEAGRDQDLLGDRDRARRVERRLARDHLLERLRPRSTPSRCSRCRRTRRGRRRRRRSGAAGRPRTRPRGGSAPRTPGPARTARAAASARPCGRGACPRRSRRPPCRRRRSCSGRGSGRRSPCPLGDQPRSSASITCLAIGAATVPPWPVVRSTVTAIATRGLSTGAKRDEPRLVHGPRPPPYRSCRPRRCPRSAAAVPVPSSTTLLIICASALAVLGFITSLCSLGFTRRTVRPSRSLTSLDEVRAHQAAAVRDRGRAPAPSAAASPAGAPGRSRPGRCRPRRERRAARRCGRTRRSRASRRAGRSSSGLRLNP